MTVRVTELDGGLRVVSAAMDQVETVSLGAWVEVGTRDEAPEINGISHLLEHMAFKGTERRNAKTIVEEIEHVGGHLRLDRHLVDGSDATSGLDPLEDGGTVQVGAADADDRRLGGAGGNEQQARENDDEGAQGASEHRGQGK